MSPSDERRQGARFITDLSVIVRSAKGASLDDRAIAHDVSVKGFKLETQVDLKQDETIQFTLELPEGHNALGAGRVVWAKRETFATWAGIKVTKMAWADKRRLAKMLDPDQVNWARIGDLALKAAFLIVLAMAAQKIAFRPKAFAGMAELLPKFAAVILMAWAFLGLIRRDKR